MNLKKSYVEKYGYERVISDRNSPLAYLELDFLKLADGQSYTIDEKGKEFALMIIYGKCDVEGKDFKFENCGFRTNPFEAPAEVVYVGKDTEFTVTGKGGDVKIAVCKAPAEKYFKPQYVAVKDIKSKDLGKGAYTRVASFNLPETVEANLLYIGEFWVEDGRWGSYPPHKHDLDNTISAMPPPLTPLFQDMRQNRFRCYPFFPQKRNDTKPSCAQNFPQPYKQASMRANHALFAFAKSTFALRRNLNVPRPPAPCPKRTPSSPQLRRRLPSALNRLRN